MLMRNNCPPAPKYQRISVADRACVSRPPEALPGKTTHARDLVAPACDCAADLREAMALLDERS